MAFDKFEEADRDKTRVEIESDPYATCHPRVMLGYPPIWRLKMLAGPRSAGAALAFED
jgi:hypothetical protein